MLGTYFLSVTKNKNLKKIDNCKYKILNVRKKTPSYCYKIDLLTFMTTHDAS